MTDEEAEIAVSYLNGFLKPFEIMGSIECNDADMLIVFDEIKMDSGSLLDAVENWLFLQLEDHYGPQNGLNDDRDEYESAEDRKGREEYWREGWNAWEDREMHFEKADWQQALREIINYDFDTGRDTGFYGKSPNPFDPPTGYYSAAFVTSMMEQFGGRPIRAWKPDEKTQEALNITRELGGNDLFFAIEDRCFRICFEYIQ